MMKKTPVEYSKEQSNNLRANISSELENRTTEKMDTDSYNVIKNLGLYMQENRDRSAIRAEKKLEPDYHYMFRLIRPGGHLNSEQLLRVFELSQGTKFAKSTMAGIKISNRQSFQVYGVTKPTIKSSLQSLDEVGMKAGSGGDLVTNIALCAYPSSSVDYDSAMNMVLDLAQKFAYKSSPYNELFLDKKADNTEENKLYTSNLLPRKFKIAFTIPPYNDVDALSNDVALLAVHNEDNSKIIGYNVLIGGGMGLVYGNTNTFAKLAQEFAYVPNEHVFETILEIAKMQRDHGNRSDRSLARMKYTIHAMGFDVFKEKVQQNLSFQLEPIKEFSLEHRVDDFSWFVDPNGTHSKTIFCPKGYMVDLPDYQYVSAISEIAKQGLCQWIITGQKNVRAINVTEENKAKIEKILEQFHVRDDYVSENEKIALACNGLPSCPLSLAESSRYLSQFVALIEAEQKKHGLEDKVISIRMSGCPNACARTYSSEIGITGVSPHMYSLWLGGDNKGTRLAQLYKENLHYKDIVKEISSLLADYKKAQSNLSFGDYCNQVVL